MSGDESVQIPTLIVSNKIAPAPIDQALTDLHNNIEDAHQLISDLEAKIAPVLGNDVLPSHDEGVTDPENTNSRIHNVVRESDARVVSLHDRIRSLIRRVEL